jgi:chromosome partitioning protein
LRHTGHLGVGMGVVISFNNEKGGVGKTTLCVQVAHMLAEKHRVLVIDNDQSGDATRALLGGDIPPEIDKGKKIEAVANSLRLYYPDETVTPWPIYASADNAGQLWLLGANDSLSVINTDAIDIAYVFEETVSKIAAHFDFVLIDCQPTFGIRTTAAMVASDAIVIPTKAEDFSVRAAQNMLMRVVRFKKNLRLKASILGVVLNDLSNPPPASVKFHIKELEAIFGPLLMHTRISRTVQIADATANQMSVLEYAKAAAKPTQQLRQLVQEILERWEQLADLQARYVAHVQAQQASGEES